MRKIVVFASLLFLSVFVCAQSPQTVKLADSLLKAGNVKAVITSYKKGNRHPIYTDTIAFRLKKQNGIISFESSKELSVFNYLQLNTRTGVIIFDHLRTTRELAIKGKFYAPLLHGFEAFWPEEMAKSGKTGNTHFGFSVGVDAGYSRPVLCLIYGKPFPDEPKTICITIFDTQDK